MTEPVDTKRIAQRIMESLEEAHHDVIERVVKRLLDLKICGSPIEAMLGAALVECDKLHGGCPVHGPLIISSEQDISHYGETARLLVHQRKFNGYRIDWVLRDPPYEVFIECDGHEFHERTKQQAAHDREKDRAIQFSGAPILRFTGSEIYADPIYCASQILDHMSELHTRPYLQAMG